MPNRRLRGQLLNIPEDVRSALAGHYRRRHAYGDIQPRAVIPRKSIRGGGVVLLITIMYYVITGYLAVLCLYNFLKEKSVQNGVMYAIIMLPLLLRLFSSSEHEDGG